MKKILVINGVNLNMLGIREKEIYGNQSYQDLMFYIKTESSRMGLDVTCVQSNYEGKIVEYIQEAYQKYEGIIINAGAYTHTSIAILDALKAVQIPTVEVHLSDINNRDEFRKFSYIGLYAEKQIVGKGFAGYKEALEYLKNK
ncbi:MAG: type II 3-dehydroquinate dehydratase [Clostridia bacterium]|nr:type II 3-dehydroquinate dehydratase [Clostridia bacterium]